MKKPAVAIFIDWFAPGYKAGGPIRSIVNLARLLHESVDVYIFTSDRDHGDVHPYPEIIANTWTIWENGIKVWYASPGRHKSIEAELRKAGPEAVYLNSLFSLPFSIQPLRWHLRKKIAERVVLVPRGMLHAGAIQYGYRKKRLFLRLIKFFQVHKKITWQATDFQEKQDIIQHFGHNLQIIQVGNVPSVYAPKSKKKEKNAGQLSVLFVSRIQPKKNLEFLIRRLAEVQGAVQLDIIGPVEDEKYWGKIQHTIKTLPESHAVHYLGAFPHHEIMERQQNYHLFCLPTHGENFGHAIFDALLGGLPLLISDQTPWKDLSNNQCGWDLPLSDIDSWNKALSEAVSWDSPIFEQRSKAASAFANQFLGESNLREQYLHLFFSESHGK